MNAAKCLRNLGCNVTQVRSITTLFPQASSMVSGTVNAITNSISARIFGPTGEDILKNINLGDKTCLITGANSGLGLEMTRCLSARDCNVIMACRNVYLANNVAKNLCENTHRLKIHEANLASLKSVKNFSDRLLKEEKQIDMVILNAGVFGIPWSLTEDGLETTFQVNYLSQIYLLLNIEKILAPNARVVFLTSESHRFVNWSIEKRLNPTEEMISLPKDKYTSIKAFNVSKLCSVSAIHSLGYRWLDTGRGVFAAHPGSFIRTRLSRNWWPYELLYIGMNPFSKSIRQAVSTPLYCATSPELSAVTALYVKNCARGAESELAQDKQLAFRLLDLTRDLLRARVAALHRATLPEPDSAPAPQADKFKNDIDDEQSLISNYSG